MAEIRKKIAAQLYSVRKEFEKDPQATLKALKEIGYQAVQVDGMRGHKAEDIAQLVKELGFSIAGMHIKHERFFNDIAGIVSECELFGSKTIFDKYIDDEDQNTEGYIKTKRQLLQVAYELSPKGYRIGLHNPEYDYINKINNRNVLQFITDPDFNVGIYAEPDTYWLACAGENPVEAIKMYSGRCPIIHLKDFKSGFDRFDLANSVAEVGSGEIAMDQVINWGEANGVEFYCVEQDSSKIGMLNSMAQSFDYLMSLENKLR
ncbi:sugar phosphate isomerase/epimerase family protein [Enterococcus sp. UD-01]|jgi:sugar phosphate isomerase/epimerase|uniref:sugar phosphate isomerase/epimerase family protein n=1 Tax=Enterococcus sp. UD-01 TaxID=3373911 RepID=UPI0038334253